MNKKLTAALTIAIFALSSVAILAPVAAHSTLGNYTPVYSFHTNDFDTHVGGPTGYVFPGSGLAAFSGTPNSFPPGYQNPYSSNPPGLPPSNYQLLGTAYSPFGAVLTDSQGSLIFALNFTCPTGTTVTDARATEAGCGPEGQSIDLGGNDLFFNVLALYLPPEFDLTQAVNNIGLVSSTFSQQFDMGIGQNSMTDPYAPGWWSILLEGNIHFLAAHNYMEWYYVKINGVKAPSIAGKYFFKMFLFDDFGMNVPGQWNTEILNPYSPTTGNSLGPLPAGAPFTGDTSECIDAPTGATTSVCQIGFGSTALTVPTQNWPVLLVKGELDPGIVTGTIRYGGYNQSLYSKPINEAGMVDMIGTANDPYTGTSTGRAVEARGYFNESATGHYEVEGVAPGVYTIYAQAAGYPTQMIAQNVTILPGQSFHLDGYLNPGPVIHGQVYSKHLFGEEAWPWQPRPIFIDLYKSNTYSDDQIVAWSPWNKTHAPYMAYDWPQPVAFTPSTGEGTILNPAPDYGTGYTGNFTAPTPLPVAFPWDTTYYADAIDSQAANPYALSYYGQTFTSPTLSPNYNSHGDLTCGGTTDVCSKPDGVGPAQYWWVDANGVFTNGGGSNSFIYQFGVKGVYGAPTEMDGHVPQPMATWVNGLTPGRYWVRAWLNGYVQTLQDGVTLDEYYFDVAANEWAGDIFMPMDLRVSSSIVKTVHFHDQAGTLMECPIGGCAGNLAQGNSAGNRYLIAEVRDSNNALVGLNYTYVSSDNSSAAITINGLGMAGPDNGFTGEVFDPMFSTLAGMKFSYYYYCLLSGECASSPSFGHDYGLPSGTYKVYVYMRGYVQQTYESVSVTLSGSPAAISNHLYRGARFNITLYSIDWEHPRVTRPWEFPGAPMKVYVMDQNGLNFYRPGTRNQPGGLLDAVYTTPALDGSCNLDYTAYGDTAVDHCRIIEWDGYGYTEYGPDYQSLQGAIQPIEVGGWYIPTSFLLSISYYRFGADQNFMSRNALESGTYTFYAFTYGYIQYQYPSVYAQKGGFGDIRIQLLQGVNLTLNVPFKTEGIYTPTAENMTMRVRVFDDSGYLIGTADTAIPDTFTANWVGPNFYNARCTPDGSVSCADAGGAGGTYYVDPFVPVSDTYTDSSTGPVDPATTGDTFLWYGTYNGYTDPSSGLPADAWFAFDSSTNQQAQSFGSYNPTDGSWWSWIPAGTKQVQVKIAGVYDYCGDPLNGCWSGVLPSHIPYAPNPDFYSYLYYGINGYSSTIPNSYTGSYTVEADFMNIYPNATFTGLLDNTPAGNPDPTNWYPPVVGLLEGDSFHTIPGSTAGAFGFTGDSLALNGLGPYAQRGPWVLPNAHLGAEASGIFEVDKRGYISGNLYGFTFANELRTVSWGGVTAVGAQGANATFTSYSWDGFYDMYLDPGSYAFTIAVPGYNSVSSSVNISSGQATSGVTFQLERSNIPVPEFTGLAVVAFSALAASVYLLRRRR